MKNLFTIFFLGISITAFSQVEINASSPNAELEVKSQTKGILLPRLNNTAVVNSPQEGLLIYDKAAKSPAFHDGAKWNNMMMMPTPSTVGQDSLTYTILSGYGPVFQLNKPLPLASMSTGASSPIAAGSTAGSISWQDLSFLKMYDANSLGFITLFGDKPTSTTVVIEIKAYKKGSASHYFSYKFSNVRVSSISYGLSNGSTGQAESISLTPTIIGFRDNVTGVSAAFRVLDGVSVPY